MFNPGDVVVLDFPGVTGVKRRPTGHFLSGLSCFTTRSGRWPDYKPERGTWTYGLCIAGLGSRGLEIPSVFRSFFVTLPRTTHPARVGRLSDRDWQGVCGCVRTALEPLAFA